MTQPAFARLAAFALLLPLAQSCSGPAPSAPVPRALGTAAVAGTVTFRVTVPDVTPITDTVFVAGDFQGWNPRHPSYALARQPDGRWTITLPLTAGQPIQFKFTRGGWDRVEKSATGQEIANRTLTPADGQTYDFTVARWADRFGKVHSFTYAPFLNGRRIWVYLPPGYDGNPRRYPVLYMHDGQNLFDPSTSFSGEWKVDEACEALIPAEIDPLIVVGIENGGATRINEYTPWPAAPYGGGGGEAYLTAIRDVLIPEVDRRYRTIADREFRFLAGSSLGGLISAYAGYAHQETFSRVACVSPSYWWDDEHMAAYAASQPRPAIGRWYQDMGTAESGSAIAELRAMRDVLTGQGFVLGVDLQSVEAAGQVHNEASWALRVPDLLRFLVGRRNNGGVQ